MKNENAAATGIRCIRSFRGHEDRIIRLSWSPNGYYLATPSDDGTIRLWVMKSDKPTHTLSNGSSGVGAIAWSPHGKLLASGSASGRIHIWRIEQNASYVISEVPQHDGVVRAMAWSPDGAFVASASDDHRIRIWDTQSWECIKTYQHSARVTSLTWSSNGAVLHGGTDDSCIISILPLGSAPRITRTKHANILDLVRSSDDMLLASSGSEGFIQIFDFWHLDDLKLINGHQGGVGSVSFSADKQLMASKSSRDSTVKIWRTTDWSELCRIPEIGDSRYYLWHSNIRFHPNLSLLATLMDGDRSVRVWEIDSNILNINFQQCGTIHLLDETNFTQTGLSTASAPPSQITIKTNPTRTSIRKALRLFFKLDSEFDAFCIDYFPDVYSRFSRGMSLEERHNIALTLVSADKILKSLHKHDPAELCTLVHIIEYEEDGI